MTLRQISKQVKGRAVPNAIEKLIKNPTGFGVTRLFDKAKPSLVEFAIKVNFNRLQRIAKITNSRIPVKAIYGGICTYTHFYSILQNRYKLDWMLSRMHYADAQKLVNKNGKFIRAINIIQNQDLMKEYLKKYEG